MPEIKKYVPSARDYDQDFNDENGHYLHDCRVCHEVFMGHKRRPSLCKLCKNKPIEEDDKWPRL